MVFFSSYVISKDFFLINFSKSSSNEIFNSCLGAYKIVKNGWETEAIPLNVDKNEQKRGFFAKIFG